MVNADLKNSVKLESLCVDLGQVSSTLNLLTECLEKESHTYDSAKEAVAALALWSRMPMFLDSLYMVRSRLEEIRTDIELVVDDLPANV